MKTICRFKEGYDIATNKELYFLQVGESVATWSSDESENEIVDILLELACKLQPQVIAD